MPIGKLIKLVHLSQARFMPNTRLVPDRNDKGYGIIDNVITQRTQTSEG